MQHTLGRNFLPTFDGSPESSTKSWVKKMDTYFQLHQVSEEEAIRVAALHLQGKVYAWWLFESSSLKIVNISTYAKFTRRLVKIFDSMPYEIYLGKQTKPKKSEPLHKVEISMKIIPFQNIVEGVKDLRHDFPKGKGPTSARTFFSIRRHECFIFKERSRERISY